MHLILIRGNPLIPKDKQNSMNFSVYCILNYLF